MKINMLENTKDKENLQQMIKRRNSVFVSFALYYKYIFYVY